MKSFKEMLEDAPVNATGDAVATNEPIVRKKKKKQDSEYREIGTPELLKRYKEDTPGQENAITESAKIRAALKKVKGLSKKQMDFMMTLPTPVLTTMINQLSALAMGEDLEEKGLWDNIRAKKARGEKMRKKGEKGAPTDDQVKRAQGEERDYKKEYANYHSSPEQIKRRAKRNEARRILKNRKGIKGKDVHHKDNNPMNNDKSNLSIVSQNFNRNDAWDLCSCFD